MMLHIPEVLDRATVAECRALLGSAQWVDGRTTAGAQGAAVKSNLQLAPDDPVARHVGTLILKALYAHPLFFSAALPLRTLPPLFNRYEGGGTYGLHVDGSVMNPAGQSHPLRSDVSTTLFFSDPDEYEGGELVAVDTYGTHEVKLPAGDMIVYPSTSLHKVEPVTRGSRVCSFFWTQSMVREDSRRGMLFDLDQTIQSLRARVGECDETVSLAAHYHNLLRLWAEV